jgi:hypothetical protein
MTQNNSAEGWEPVSDVSGWEPVEAPAAAPAPASPAAPKLDRGYSSMLPVSSKEWWQHFTEPAMSPETGANVSSFGQIANWQKQIQEKNKEIEELSKRTIDQKYTREQRDKDIQSRVDDIGSLARYIGGNQTVGRILSGLSSGEGISTFAVSLLGAPGRIASGLWGAGRSAQGLGGKKEGETTADVVERNLLAGAGVSGSAAMIGSGVKPLSPRAGKTVQKIARRVTGVESAVKESVGKAVEAQTKDIAENRAARLKTLKENVAKQRKAGYDISRERIKTAEENIKIEAANKEQAAKVQQRAELAKSVDTNSLELRNELETVEKAVAKEANAKFDQVRAKVGDATVPSDELISSVKDVEANVLQGIPENIKEFRAILRMGDAGELNQLRQDVMTGQQMQGTYDALSPERKAVVDRLVQNYGGEITPNEPVSWNKLQSLKSRLDARLRNSRGMNGDLKRGLFQVRDQVVEQMGKLVESTEKGKKYAYRSRDVGEQGVPSQSHSQASLSEEEVRTRLQGGRGKTTGKDQEVVRVDLSKLSPQDYTIMRGPNGQDWVKFTRDLPESSVETGPSTATQWKQARDFWKQYKEDFHEATGPSGSGSPVAQALNAVDPNEIRSPFLRKQTAVGNRGLQTLRKYGTFGGDTAAALAQRVLAEHEAMSALPEKLSPKPMKVSPEVHKLPASKALPPKAETPIVDIQQVAKKAIADRAKNWGSFNARDIGIIGSSILLEPIVKMLSPGQGASNLLPAAAMGYEATKYFSARALNSPKVIEWLSKAPAAEVDVLSRIPGADKVKIMDGITQVAKDASKGGKPVTLSPEAKRFLGPARVAQITGTTGAGTRKPAGQAISDLNSLRQKQKEEDVQEKATRLSE